MLYPGKVGDEPLYVPFFIVPFFLVGMTSGSLHKRLGKRTMPDWMASSVIGALIIAAFLTSHTVYAVQAVILLGAAFYLIASGCTIFGILTSSPARRLGDASYGIYSTRHCSCDCVFGGTD